MKATVEDLLKKTPSIYRLTNMAIKRALELSQQAPAVAAGAGEPQMPVVRALNEILEGKISCKDK